MDCAIPGARSGIPGHPRVVADQRTWRLGHLDQVMVRRPGHLGNWEADTPFF